MKVLKSCRVIVNQKSSGLNLVLIFYSLSNHVLLRQLQVVICAESFFEHKVKKYWIKTSFFIVPFCVFPGNSFSVLFCSYCFKSNLRSLDTWIVNYWLRQEAVICICITHYLNTYVIHLYPGWKSCNVKIPIVYCSLFVTEFNPFRIPFDLEFVFDGRARLPVNKMSSYCSKWFVMLLLCWITWS